MSEIEVFTKKDAISVTKLNNTMVDYYIFDEYEIHNNTIPPHTIQEWHMHKRIEEVIIVTSGIITIKWMENGEATSLQLYQDNIIRVKQSIHTIENCSDSKATFIVFRMVPDGRLKRDIIKEDKIIIDDKRIQKKTI